jgi:hypothetical protein
LLTLFKYYHVHSAFLIFNFFFSYQNEPQCFSASEKWRRVVIIYLLFKFIICLVLVHINILHITCQTWKNGSWSTKKWHMSKGLGNVDTDRTNSSQMHEFYELFSIMFIFTLQFWSSIDKWFLRYLNSWMHYGQDK